MIKLVILATFAVVVLATSTSYHLQKWGEFKENHQKTYKNAGEELRRFEIFKSNVELIEQHNKLYENGQSSYKMGINEFTDLTVEEFKDFLRKSYSKKPKFENVGATKFEKPSEADIPDTIDWRTKGAVLYVKNQGICGSCWAFSATGSLEGQKFLSTGELIALSEQELMDCSSDNGNSGCNGGFMDGAFDYVTKNGIVSGEDYPYRMSDHSCARGNIPAAFTISGYKKTIPNDEEDLKAAVGIVGPVSVAVNADYWQWYASGIFDDKRCGNSPDDLNHGVLAVGYGTENGLDYWLVKNSWGASFGEQGYIRTVRNANNQCGIATDCSYPTV